MHVFVDRFQRLRAQIVLVHGNEPLIGRAEDDRLMATPAMRIAMDDIDMSNENSLLAQPFDDARVSLIHIKTRKRTCFVGEHAIIVDRHEDRKIELKADQVVVLAMTRSRMDRAGTRVERDMIAIDDHALKISGE